MLDAPRTKDDTLAALLRTLISGVTSRVDSLESSVEALAERVDHQNVAQHSEHRVQTDRIISAIDRLGRVEAIPERLDRLEGELGRRNDRIDRELVSMSTNLGAVTTRLDNIETQLKLEEVRSTTRKETVQQGVKIISWVVENWWKLVSFVALIVMIAKAYLPAEWPTLLNPPEDPPLRQSQYETDPPAWTDELRPRGAGP